MTRRNRWLTKIGLVGTVTAVCVWGLSLAAQRTRDAAARLNDV